MQIRKIAEKYKAAQIKYIKRGRLKTTIKNLITSISYSHLNQVISDIFKKWLNFTTLTSKASQIAQSLAGLHLYHTKLFDQGNRLSPYCNMKRLLYSDSFICSVSKGRVNQRRFQLNENQITSQLSHGIYLHI